jgi:glycosyltransferase involved in cell wall biosynthesis
MKWLLVGDGSSVHIRRLATALADRNIETHVACFEGMPIAGIGWHRLGTLPSHADRRYPLAVPRLIQLISRLQPEVVNAHYLTSYGLMAALTPYPGILVQTVWGSDLLVTVRESFFRRHLAALALRRAGRATGDAAILEDKARELAPNIQWHRFVFGPDARLLELDLPRANVIVSARSLIPEMRVGLAARGFAQAQLRDWRLVVAGAGSEEIPSGHGIEVIGALPQSHLHRLMAASRALVSVPRSDATSAVVLEGLAVGLLPIVNDLPANREWLDDRSAVFVPRDPSVEQMAAAFRRAVEMDVNFARQRARVRSVTWDTQVDDLVEMARRSIS